MSGNEPDSRSKRDKALFNDIAESYSAKDNAQACIPARKMRLLQSLSISRHHSTDQPDILEVGCGTGYSARYLQGQYKSYTGVDYSEALIDHARETHQADNIKFEACDFYQYESDEKFDVIFMIGVLHHMDEIESALLKCRHLLKNGGCLIANEPQPGNPVVQGMRKIRKLVDSNYSDEQEFLSPALLMQAYKQAGFTEISTVPQGYLSTPFAEVILRPQMIFSALSKLACKLDGYIETRPGSLLRKLSWNVIAYGRHIEK